MDDDLRFILDRLPEGALLVSSAGVVLIANTRASLLLKRPKQDLEGVGLDLLSNMELSGIHQRIKPCLRSSNPVPVAIPFSVAETNHFEIKTEGFLFKPATENCSAQIILRLRKKDLATSQFITLNKEIEKQNKTVRLLMASQSKLINVTDELNHYVDIVDKYIISSTADKDGKLTRVSEAFCETSQYQREELIGQSHDILQHPDASEDTYKDLWSSVSKGELWQGELENQTKDGHTYYVHANVEPEFDEQNGIIGYTAIWQNMTDRKRVEELSERDILTKLYNRLKLDAVVTEEINIATRYQTPFSIIFLDIDHFKKINDEHGHLIGDKTLIELSNMISARVRQVDIVGRWGGEEFLIICPETDVDGAKALAENICRSISEHVFPEIHKCTCSCGVAEFEYGDSYMNLLKKADDALYSAKEAGRNQVKTAYSTKPISQCS